MKIYLLLTEDCNLQCAMCVRGKQHGVKIDVTLLKKVVKENNFSCHDVVVTGGEPTLHPQFTEIVDIMCRNAKNVIITSNGTTNIDLSVLKKYENLFFQISLDGDADMHNFIRGNNAFERTWSNVHRLDELGLKYTISSVVGKKNYQEIDLLIPKLCSLTNLMYWNISFEMPFGSSDLSNVMSADEWNQFVNDILKKVPFRFKIKKLFPFSLYEKRKNDLDKNINQVMLNCNCSSGKEKLYIYPDFKVYPCTCLTDFCIGDLITESLDEILNGDRIERFKNYTVVGDSVCKKCEYLKYCNGGCMGMSYHYYGKLGMGDKRCPKIIEIENRR